MRKIVSSVLSVLITFQPLFADTLSAKLPGNIRIPSKLGFVSDFYSPASKEAARPEFIFIQDLHVNRSVQFHISSILNSLKKRGLLPERLAVEGASGPFDLSALQQYKDVRVRRDACDYLVKQGELPGAFHFLISQGSGSAFGVERADLYDASLAVYKESYDRRSTAINKLDQLDKALQLIGKKGTNAANVQELDQEVENLRHLISGQVTPNDLNVILKSAPLSAASVASLLPTDQRLDVVKPVVAMADFYSLALLRDEAMLDGLMSLRKKDHQRTTVEVVGGFHTAGLTAALKRLGYSYVVITPNISQSTRVDEQLYVERMLERHLSASQAASAKDWARTLADQPRYTVGGISTLFWSFVRGAGAYSWGNVRDFSIRRLTASASVLLGMASLVWGWDDEAPPENFRLGLQSSRDVMWWSIGIATIVLIVLSFVLVRKLNEKREVSKMKIWLASTAPNDYEQILAKHPINRLMVVYSDVGQDNHQELRENDNYHYRELAERIGVAPFLDLVAALEPHSSALGLIAKKVFPILHQDHYDLAVPEVLLNKRVLLDGLDKAVRRPAENLSGDVYKDYISEFDKKSVVPHIIELINESKILNDGPLPDISLRLKLRRLYEYRASKEWELRVEVGRRMHPVKPNSSSGSELGQSKTEREVELTAQLHDLDVEVVHLEGELDRARGVLGRPAIASATGGRFPVRGSTKGAPENFYTGVSNEIMQLMHFLAERESFSKGDGLFIPGSDLKNVPAGSVGRSIKHDARWVIIAGGAGGYKPDNWDTEAQGFGETYERVGQDWSHPPISVFLETQSDSSEDHAKAFARMLREKNLPLDYGIVIAQQSPMMQLRAKLTLQKALDEEFGKGKIRVVSDTPFYRSFDFPPYRWELAIWRQRLAWDGPREIFKLIEDSRNGKIYPLKISKNCLVAARLIAEQLSRDESIPIDRRLEIPLWIKTFNSEIEKSGTAATAGAIHASPFTQASWMPKQLGIFLAAILYPVRVVQELVHAGVLLLAGVPISNIKIHFEFQNPEVEISDDVPGVVAAISAFAGPLTHIMLGLALPLLLPHVAAIPLLTILVQIIIGTNIVEFLASALPYRLKNHADDVLSSDMQQFIDGVKAAVEKMPAVRRPAFGLKDLAAWDYLFPRSVHQALSKSRSGLVFAFNA